MRELERVRELEERRRKRTLAISEKLRREEDKRMELVRKNERVDRKRKMEERWEIVRWLTSYIGENSDRWETEKRERDLQLKRRLDEWDRERRFEKIKIIRKREKRRNEGENGDPRERVYQEP